MSEFLEGVKEIYSHSLKPLRGSEKFHWNSAFRVGMGGFMATSSMGLPLTVGLGMLANNMLSVPFQQSMAFAISADVGLGFWAGYHLAMWAGYKDVLNPRNWK
jgi:hypothetical protein